MPEYHMPTGSGETVPTFDDLPPIVQGYIHAMFFTDHCQGDWDDHENRCGDIHPDATYDDIAPETLRQIIRDCVSFWAINREDIAEACDNGRINGYDLEAVGRDFWYSRNGHGCGFFDRDLGDVGDTLQEACGWRTDFAEVYPYTGDNGLIYL